MLQYIASLSFIFLNVHSAHQNSPDDEAKALKALIYHLYVDNSSKVDEMPEALAAVEASLKSDFRPKDFWNDKEYSFGYGKSPRGDLVLFAWKNDRSIPDMSLSEIKERYLDDRFAKIQDSKNLESWKLARKDIAGSFIGLRRGDLSVEMPIASQKAPDVFEKVQVNSYPLIVIISSKDSKKLQASKAAMTSNEKDKIN
jgi:hypothetical protein